MSNSTQANPVRERRQRIEDRIERMKAAHAAICSAGRWLYRDLGVLAQDEPAYPARRSAAYHRVRDLCRALKTLDNKVLALQLKLDAELHEFDSDLRDIDSADAA